MVFSFVQILISICCIACRSFSLSVLEVCNHFEDRVRKCCFYFSGARVQS
ncbi:hypothetical protein GLYMA_02G184500v4 [Glycine max]|nr:hypothetical protein GLYMA_02G184500v4 [Glycine max]KAH1060970.1 hypothetical protein GYH30_004452 [Glycine max]